MRRDRIGSDNPARIIGISVSRADLTEPRFNRATAVSRAARPTSWRDAQDPLWVFEPDKAVDEILTDLFNMHPQAQGAFHFALRNPLPKRSFCVQYEDDWNFCHRLMETEGLFGYFEQATDGKSHTLVITDDTRVLGTEHRSAGSRDGMPHKETDRRSTQHFAIRTGAVTEPYHTRHNAPPS